jgi:hypothetical protein
MFISGLLASAMHSQNIPDEKLAAKNVLRLRTKSTIHSARV